MRYTVYEDIKSILKITFWSIIIVGTTIWVIIEGFMSWHD